jgi:hypothetical protein
MLTFMATFALAAPYYESTEFRGRGFAGDHELRVQLTDELRRHRLRLTLETRGGEETRLRPSSPRWTPFVAASILLVLRNAEPGA